jgi:endoglucanase
MNSSFLRAAFITLGLIMLQEQLLFSQDLLSIQPVTDKILLLKISEGHVDYTDTYGRSDKSLAYFKQLAIEKATTLSTYGITSETDTSYRSSQVPLAIGRKSKGAHYLDMRATPPFLLEHNVYLELPKRMKTGVGYTVSFPGLVENVNEVNFTFNESEIISPTIHVTSLGFTPHGAKVAYLSQWMGSFNTKEHTRGAINLDSYEHGTFKLVTVSEKKEVYRGVVRKRSSGLQRETVNSEFGMSGNFTNSDVWECDFSSFTIPGEYFLVVDKLGRSTSFEIQPSAYREAYRFVSKAIFTQRQGVDKQIEHGVYPRGHHPQTSRVYFTGTEIPLNIWGYYYDAGDWDGHNRHIAVPLDLLLLYDLKSESFYDGDINNRYRLSSNSPWINEGKDKVPDVLNEASWLIRFYKRAKDELIAKRLGTGGVPGGRLPNQHGVIGEGFIGPDAECENRTSWTDDRTVYVNGEQTANTYLYSAVAAYYSTMIDKCTSCKKAEAITWKEEAINSYNWCLARNDDETGEDVIQAKMLASAAIYRLLKDDAYQKTFLRLIKKDKTFIENYDAWHRMNMWHYAAMIYGRCEPSRYASLDTAAQKQLTQKLITLADHNYLATGSGRGFRFGFEDRRNASNGVFSVPRTEILAFAHSITGDQKYLHQIQHNANYTLGGNENNMTYVAGLGHNPDNNTFHPDSWRLLDLNSRVHINPSLPGYVNYYGANCDWFKGCAYEFTGDEDFSRSSAFPPIEDWPASEWRMNNRYSIAGSEFTMDECLGQAAFTYGYLSEPSEDFSPNKRPEVMLHVRKDQSGGIELSVNASNDTQIVRYFVNHHLIGESTDGKNKFRMQYKAPITIEKGSTITAIAVDNKGLVSWPTRKSMRCIQ